MRMNQIIASICCCAVVLLTTSLLAPGAATAAVINVPGDQPTIQAGIDAALAGDTVLLAPGTYSGPGNHSLDFQGKDLILKSEDGAAVTVLDGEALYGAGPRAMIFASGESAAAIVDGLTFFQFSAPGPQPFYGGAILVQGASPTIQNCVFDHNYSDGQGGVIYLDQSSSVIQSCTFTQNWGMSAGGGINAWRSDVRVSSESGSPPGSAGEARRV